MAKKNTEKATLTALETNLGILEAERSLGVGSAKASLRSLLRLHSGVLASGGTAAKAKAAEKRAVRHGDSVLKSVAKANLALELLKAIVTEEEAKAEAEASPEPKPKAKAKKPEVDTSEFPELPELPTE